MIIITITVIIIIIIGVELLTWYINNKELNWIIIIITVVVLVAAAVVVVDEVDYEGHAWRTVEIWGSLRKKSRNRANTGILVTLIVQQNNN
jgi:hypothetical protein